MDHVLIRCALVCLAAACSTPDAPSPPEACHDLAHTTGAMFARCGLGSHVEGLHLVIGDRATGTHGPEDGCNRAVSYDADLLDACLADLAETCDLELAEACARAVCFDDEISCRSSPDPGHLPRDTGTPATCCGPRDEPGALLGVALQTPAIRCAGVDSQETTTDPSR